MKTVEQDETQGLQGHILRPVSGTIANRPFANEVPLSLSLSIAMSLIYFQHESSPAIQVFTGGYHPLIFQDHMDLAAERPGMGLVAH